MNGLETVVIMSKEMVKLSYLLHQTRILGSNLGKWKEQQTSLFLSVIHFYPTGIFEVHVMRCRKTTQSSKIVD